MSRSQRVRASLWVRGIGATLFVAALLLPCRQASAQGTPVVVGGNVVASDTGRAISNAEVSVSGTNRTATTGQLGRFRIEGVTPGVVVLTVRAPGYLEGRVADVQAGSRSATELVIELDSTPNFQERVQVTGSRTPQTIADLGALADVVDRAAMERRNDQELVQAVANIPGAIVSGQAGIFDSVLFRGLPRDGNEFTTTMLMIDGVPQLDSRNSARVVNLPIWDASSIEVVRGPNSALYGRTAIGGTINVRTADPTPEREVAFDFVRGQFGMTRGIARISGPIKDWGGYYISGGLDRNVGYFEDDLDYEVLETGAFGKFTVAPDDRSFGSVTLQHMQSDNSLPTNLPVIDGRLLSDLDPRFDRLTNLNIPGTNYHQDENRFTLNYSRQLTPRVRAVGVFGYRAITYEFIDDGDVIGAPFDLENNTLTMYPFEQRTDEDILYQEGRLELTPDLGAFSGTLLVGASYERNSGKNAGNLIYTDADLLGWTLDYLDPDIPDVADWQREAFGQRDYTVGNTGLFFQYAFEPSSRLLLTAGGRYDRLALETTSFLIEGQPTVEDDFSAFSPKVSATYRLSGDASRPAFNLYGTYSQAFLAPRRPSDLVPRDFVVNLEPEDIANYEVGVKGTAMQGRLIFEGAYFYMTRDGVVGTVRQGPFFVPTNSGEHRYKGIETGASYAASDRLTFYANAAFYRNRFGDFVIETSDGDVVLTDNRLPISPDTVVNWGGVYKLRPAVDVTLNVKHVGEVEMDQRNTVSFDAYSLVDTAVTYRVRVLRISLSARNLFNSDYFWGGDTSLAESADPGRPRQVLLSIGAVFK